MNLDELQSVQSRERQASSLQHLRSSFYEEAADYVGELRAERNEVAAASDNPFDDPEVERLSDEIRTAEGTVESIYERRVGKVVKLASIAAADMPYDDEGLTKEEEQLFGRLVEAIDGNRDRVLSVLDGESPSLDCTPAEGGEREPTPAQSDPADPATSGGTPDRANAADAGPNSGAGDSHGDPGATEGRPTPPDRPAGGDEPNPTPAEAADSTGPADGPSEGDPLDIGSAMGGSESDDTKPAGAEDRAPARGEQEPRAEVSASVSAPSAPAGDSTDRDEGGEASETGDEGPVERTMVRVTADVGNIFGVDGRSYDLSAEDVVTLPTSNAENLVSKDAAVRLD